MPLPKKTFTKSNRKKKKNKYIHLSSAPLKKKHKYINNSTSTQITHLLTAPHKISQNTDCTVIAAVASVC